MSATELTKVKTADLTGDALDWAVCKAIQDELAASSIQFKEHATYYPKTSPSTNWAQGGPIVESSKITWLYWPEVNEWWATLGDARSEETLGQSGPTPLIAAMRCYVEGEFGEEIEVPLSLVKDAPSASVKMKP